jgi:hypothetical protein
MCVVHKSSPSSLPLHRHERQPTTSIVRPQTRITGGKASKLKREPPQSICLMKTSYIICRMRARKVVSVFILFSSWVYSPSSVPETDVNTIRRSIIRFMTSNIHIQVWQLYMHVCLFIELRYIADNLQSPQEDRSNKRKASV